MKPWGSDTVSANNPIWVLPVKEDAMLHTALINAQYVCRYPSSHTMQLAHAKPEVDALTLLELPLDALRMILGPKYIPAATTCRKLCQLSRSAAEQLVIQFSSH